jgi:two-component system cell cycle sensor histidine kinase/response regulator CckA
MFSALRSLLSPYRRAREEFAVARTLQFLLLAIFAGLLVGFFTSRDYPEKPILGITLLAAVFSLIFNQRGRQAWAIRITIASMLLLASALAYSSTDGIRSIAIPIFPAVLVVAALLLDPAWYVGLAALTVAVVTAVGWREMDMVAHGRVIARSVTKVATIVQVDCILIVAAVAVGLLGRNLRVSLQRTRRTVEKLNEANQQLQDSEKRFRALVELAVDAIFITDHAGRILDVNQRACSLTGYPSDKLLGLSIAEIVACDANSITWESASQLPAGGGQEANPVADRPRTTETEVKCADGSRVSVELNSMTLPIGVVQIFCRDTTERRRTEEQIRQMQKMESIGRLAGGVAHDFNNLLTVIQGYSDLLLERMDSSDRGREAVREIHAAAEHAAGLTHQLLTFSRKRDAHLQKVELAALVESSRKMLRLLLGESIEIVVRRDPGAAVTMADPVQMHQVLVNLAVNARDAMPDGGTLSIATSVAAIGVGSFDSGGEIAPGKYVSLTVSDTGVGITDDAQKKIFEPFFTTKEVGKGTGLGLATVYGIVHQYKGFIQVRSALGKGSTFAIYLPLSEGLVEAIAESTPIPSRPGSETVLVAEDQDAVRQLTIAILRASGYRVLDAVNGEEALRLVRSGGERVDLLLTDVMMPRMNGRELVEQIRVLQPDLKVIYVSGYSHDIIAPKNLPEGGVNLLAKPFSPDALAALVRKVLDTDVPSGQHPKAQSAAQA